MKNDLILNPFLSPKRSSAFSMVEVLVATAILAVLSGLVATAANVAMLSAEKAREVGAGRNLIVAYQLAATENDGNYLPGYDRTIGVIDRPNGTSIHGPAASRYPFRLAPYFDNQVDGTLLVNRNARQVDSSDSYMVSCYPAFGINYLYLGGDLSASGTLTIPDEVVTRSAQAANVLAFASSGSRGANGIINGFNILTPPATYGPLWSFDEWKSDSDPGSFGHVHPRYAGKAVCVFVDGSIRILGIEELRDMRLWSKGAIEADDKNYTVSTRKPGGGRR